YCARSGCIRQFRTFQETPGMKLATRAAATESDVGCASELAMPRSSRFNTSLSDPPCGWNSLKRGTNCADRPSVMEQRPLPEALPEPNAPEPRLEVGPAPAEVDGGGGG